jgi:hypothetical protein
VTDPIYTYLPGRFSLFVRKRKWLKVKPDSISTSFSLVTEIDFKILPKILFLREFTNDIFQHNELISNLKKQLRNNEMDQNCHVLKFFIVLSYISSPKM